jgi:hypothetical protein
MFVCLHVCRRSHARTHSAMRSVAAVRSAAWLARWRFQQHSRVNRAHDRLNFCVVASLSHHDDVIQVIAATRPVCILCCVCAAQEFCVCVARTAWV